MNTNTSPSSPRQGSRQAGRSRIFLRFRLLLVSFIAATVIASLFIARREHLAQEQGLKEIQVLRIRYERLRHHVDSLQGIVTTINQRVNLINQLAFGDMTTEEWQPTVALASFESDGPHDSEDVLSTLFVNINLLRRKVFRDSITQPDMLELAKFRQKMYTSVPAIWPLANHPIASLASGYGMREHPIFHMIKMHQGIDFAAPLGTLVFATAEGEVIAADTAFVGYGTLVIVDHGLGYQTRYAHLGKMMVKLGDRVSQGQVIARVGNTGLSTAAHLHYEILLQGVPINPISFLFHDVEPADYQRLISLAFLQNQSMGN